MLLTFDFATIEEAQEFLRGLTDKGKPAAPPPSAAQSEPVTPLKDSPKADKPKRNPKPEKPAKTEAYTIDDARAALARLFENKGRDAAIALLKKHKAARITDVPAMDYAAFIADCVAGGQ